MQQETALYTEECLDFLRQALARAQEEENDGIPEHFYNRKADSSSDEEDKDDSDDENHSSDSEDETNQQTEASTKPKEPARKQSPPKVKLLNIGKPPCVSWAFQDDSVLNVPSALLTQADSRTEQCQSLLSTATQMAEGSPVIILLLKSGRFAGGVFVRSKCVTHRALQRYTVRKGQGKAQSTQDGNRRPKSMGAQLRRAGEENLRQDVTRTLEEWKEHLRRASLVLISCPKTMRKGLFEGGVLTRDDPRIRRVPLDVGRPTFEAVNAVYHVMLKVTVTPKAEETADSAREQVMTAEQLPAEKPAEEEIVKRTVETIPMTPLHEAARDGDISEILHLLSGNEVEVSINQLAGPMFMAPLHYAAESKADPATSSACVSALLLQGHADPCVKDERNRVPYFLASHDKVREAFRIARATLGEDYCSWDEEAKVGPPLTKQDIRNRKEKEAEKKRKKRARQKDKKAKDRAAVEAAKEQQQQEEQRRKQEEDAKRIRDGLEPKKSNAPNVCDYCQTVCKGKRRNQMFKRLDYVYCSTTCVQCHKRELMAAAALKRFES